MSKTVHSVKLLAYDSVDLDRLSYSSGDVVYDVTNGTLRLMDGVTAGGSKIATRSWVQSSAGTITANLIGNVTGNITGNAGSVTNGIYNTDVGTITSTMIANGTIQNTDLANTTIRIGNTTITLGGVSLTLSGLSSVSATSFTGALTGNSTTSTTLATARAINGVNFDGSADITITADASTLTNTTLNSTIVTSSLTTVGTLNALTVQNDINANSNVVVPTLPTLNNHATNKKYVDAKATALSIALGG